MALLSAVNCVGALLPHGTLRTTPLKAASVLGVVVASVDLFLSSRDEIMASCFISSFKNYSDKASGLLSPCVALISILHSPAPFPSFKSSF